MSASEERHILEAAMYFADKDQKSLRIWKDRVRRYFSKIERLSTIE